MHIPKTLRIGIAAFSVLFACLALPAGAPASGVAHYRNPVFAKDFPDPMVLRVTRNQYYAYGTSTPWELGYFPILHSRDLVHWKYVGDIFKIPPKWTTGDLWAPDVIKRGRTYYAYYVGLKTSTHCVAVATAPRPTGPFKQRRVLGCGDAGGQGYIDPSVFIDANGKAYLYVSVDSPQHDISVFHLTSDLMHVSGPRIPLFGITQTWEHGQNFSTVEGPYLIRHNKQYYLFYSGNDWNGSYAMGYAIGASPTGPFTKCTCNPVLNGDSKVHGPGGGSVVTGPDGKLWMVYHGWPGKEGYSNGGIRNMRIDPLDWHAGNEVTIPVTP